MLRYVLPCSYTAPPLAAWLPLVSMIIKHNTHTHQQRHNINTTSRRDACATPPCLARVSCDDTSIRPARASSPRARASTNTPQRRNAPTTHRCIGFYWVSSLVQGPISSAFVLMASWQLFLRAPVAGHLTQSLGYRLSDSGGKGLGAIFLSLLLGATRRGLKTTITLSHLDQR